MFDTYVTLVGNVLTAPEWRRTKNTGQLVANFKVASTARRLDRDTGKWVDRDSLRVRVTCWRKLAEGVAACVITGNPVIVVGRMYTRDWTDDAGTHRVMYELEAVAIGHDLSRGMSQFVRSRPSTVTSSVEDEHEPALAGGQPTDPVPDDEVPARRDDGYFDEFGDGLSPLPVSPAAGYGPSGAAFTAGPVDAAEDDEEGDEDVDGDGLDGDGLDGGDLDEEDDLLGDESAGRGVPPGEGLAGEAIEDGFPASGEGGSGAIGADGGGFGDADAPPRRSRRRVRTPIPA
jgi:single-strand DNA-binding protein